MPSIWGSPPSAPPAPSKDDGAALWRVDDKTTAPPTPSPSGPVRTHTYTATTYNIHSIQGYKWRGKLLMALRNQLKRRWSVEDVEYDVILAWSEYETCSNIIKIESDGSRVSPCSSSGVWSLCSFLLCIGSVWSDSRNTPAPKPQDLPAAPYTANKWPPVTQHLIIMFLRMKNNDFYNSMFLTEYVFYFYLTFILMFYYYYY